MLVYPSRFFSEGRVRLHLAHLWPMLPSCHVLCLKAMPWCPRIPRSHAHVGPQNEPMHHVSPELVEGYVLYCRNHPSQNWMKGQTSKTSVISWQCLKVSIARLWLLKGPDADCWLSKVWAGLFKGGTSVLGGTLRYLFGRDDQLCVGLKCEFISPLPGIMFPNWRIFAGMVWSL